MRGARCGIVALGLALGLAGGQDVARGEEPVRANEQIAWRLGRKLAMIAVEACDERITEEILDDGYGPGLGEDPHFEAWEWTRKLGVPLPELPPLSYEDARKNVPTIVRYLLEKEIPEWRKAFAERHGSGVDRVLAFSLSLHLYAWSEAVFSKDAERWRAQLWKELEEAQHVLALPRHLWAKPLEAAADEEALNEAAWAIGGKMNVVLEAPAARESPPPSLFRILQYGAMFTQWVVQGAQGVAGPEIAEKLTLSASRVQAPRPLVLNLTGDPASRAAELKHAIPLQLKTARQRIQLLYGDEHAAAFALSSFGAAYLTGDEVDASKVADEFVRIAGASSVPKALWQPTANAIRTESDPRALIHSVVGDLLKIVVAYREKYAGSPEQSAQRFRRESWDLGRLSVRWQDYPEVAPGREGMSKAKELRVSLPSPPSLPEERVARFAATSRWLRSEGAELTGSLDARASRAGSFFSLGVLYCALYYTYEPGAAGNAEAAEELADVAAACWTGDYWFPAVSAIRRNAPREEVVALLDKAAAWMPTYLGTDD